MQIAGAAGKDAQVHKLVAKLSPHYRNTYSLAGTFTFELPARDTKLSQVFADMIAARKVRRPQRRRAETVMPCMLLASYEWCMWFTAAAGRRRLADPQSKLRDASPPSPLSHTQAQVLTSWGISSCTLEDAFIKIAQQGAEDAQLPPSTAALGTVGQQGRCLPRMLRFAKNRQGN